MVEQMPSALRFALDDLGLDVLLATYDYHTCGPKLETRQGAGQNHAMGKSVNPSAFWKLGCEDSVGCQSCGPAEEG